MTDDAHGQGLNNDTPADDRKVCGIVMPIAAMPDDYTVEHWRRVRMILERAIEQAGMRPQLVWENPDIDVIQTKILQNLYENDVVICDVSGLNPNVMLETGLRLSTKRPTVIVTDKVKSPPFDIGTIGYEEYRRDLEYNATDAFIKKLSKKLSDVLTAAEASRYVSFVENYRFETVTPSTVTVTSEQYFTERLDELTSLVRRLERSNERVFIPPSAAWKRPTVADIHNTAYTVGYAAAMPDDVAETLAFHLEMIDNAADVKITKGPNDIKYIRVQARPNRSPEQYAALDGEIRSTIQSVSPASVSRADA